MLDHYFGAHGWAFERTCDDEIVANVQGSWASYELRAVWRVYDRVLQFLALPDIRVPSDKRIAIYETIGLINEQLWLGHFEMWSSDGLVLFRHAAMLECEDDEGEGPLTLDHAQAVVEAAIRSDEQTSELQSLMRISYAVFCLQNTKIITSTQLLIKKKENK